MWWRGPLGKPDRAVIWRAYVRRFASIWLEHTSRVLTHTLNWTLPCLRHPEQADRWTWLVVLAYTQLRLARPLVADLRLPWNGAATEPPTIAIAGQHRTQGMIARKDRHHDRRKSPSRYCGWVVERMFGWLSRNRRMSKEYERKTQTSETLIELAVIRLLVACRGRQTS